MSANNNPKGILLIITAMTFFSMQDALIKFIYEQAALYEIFFGRYFVAAIFLLGEKPTQELFIGGAIIIIGVILIVFTKNKKEEN